MLETLLEMLITYRHSEFFAEKTQQNLEEVELHNSI